MLSEYISSIELAQRGGKFLIHGPLHDLSDLRPFISFCHSYLWILGLGFWRPINKRRKRIQVILKFCYCSIIFMAVLTYLVYYITASFMDTHGVVRHAGTMIWHIKALLQGMHFMFLSTLSWFSTKNDVFLVLEEIWYVVIQQVKRRRQWKSFRRRINVMMSVFFLMCLLDIAVIASGLFWPEKHIQAAYTDGIKPLPISAATKIVRLLIVSFLFFASVLPIGFFCFTCEVIIYAFSSLYYTVLSSTLEMPDSRTNPSKAIHFARKHFVRLTELCQRVDNILSFLPFLVYSFDTVIACLTLYGAIYFAVAPFQYFTFTFWLVNSLFLLLALSMQAARVSEKAREMTFVAAKFDPTHLDTISRTELSMLLFHISSDTVTMTCWKLLPLYKSVIISVFLSIVTYFTLIIQFR